MAEQPSTIQAVATTQNLESGGAPDTSFVNEFPDQYFPPDLYTQGASFYTANQPWIKPYAEKAQDLQAGDDSSGKGSGQIQQATAVAPDGSTVTPSMVDMISCSNCG